MKTLVGFRYWITGIIVVVIGIVFVAHKQHDAAEKYKRHRAEYCSALGSTPQQKKECIEKRTSARDYLPWGYDLVGWPEGITTWAILLTLGAIIWQSSETRKAARAAEKSVAQEKDFFIQSQRPRLIVSAFYLKSRSGEVPEGLRRIDGSWHSGQFCVTNTGGTEATVKRVLCICPVLDSLPAKRPWEGQPGREVNFSLEPGSSEPYAFTIESQSTDEENVGITLTQHRTLYAMGWIDYEDARRVRRTTRFCRRYDPKQVRFWPVENDPDYESQD